MYKVTEKGLGQLSDSGVPDSKACSVFLNQAVIWSSVKKMEKLEKSRQSGMEVPVKGMA